MMRCVLVAGVVALLAMGCALEPRGQGDASEADAGSSSPGTTAGNPPVAPPNSGGKGGAPSSGSSSGATAPGPGDDGDGDHDSDDGGEEPDADTQDAGPKGPGHGHR